jgi:hypothetical protein
MILKVRKYSNIVPFIARTLSETCFIISVRDRVTSIMRQTYMVPVEGQLQMLQNPIHVCCKEGYFIMSVVI